MEPTDRPPVDWAAVRVAYERDEQTLGAICTRFGITRRVLSGRAGRELWAPRNTSQVSRPLIIKRLFRLLERQIMQLEQDMTSTGDKEVAVLGKLASTLEKLIDIDNAATAAAPRAKGAVRQRDIKELREKLAIRIAHLRQG